MRGDSGEATELATAGPVSDGTVVAAQELWKLYRMGNVEVPALRGVDLQIAAGEFVAVTGPSGSGKSTLLHLLGLIDSPTRGRMMIAGVDASSLPANQRSGFRLHHIGFVFQFFNLFVELTALENVMLPAMLAGQGAATSRGRAMEMLERVSLAERARHRPSQLSGGEQQRVSIARALINRPALLLADEPTAHLDSTRAQEIMALLLKLNRDAGQTIVLVTHEREYSEIAQRTIMLKDGRIERVAAAAGAS